MQAMHDVTFDGRGGQKSLASGHVHTGSRTVRTDTGYDTEIAFEHHTVSEIKTEQKNKKTKNIGLLRGETMDDQ